MAFKRRDGGKDVGNYVAGPGIAGHRHGRYFYHNVFALCYLTASFKADNSSKGGLTLLVP